MNAEPFTRTWQVGARTCTLTAGRDDRGQVACCIEWKPLPERLSDAELREYRAGRDAAIAELAEHFDVQTLVIET
ncbi:MAG: hypothetical protein IPI03_14525 [Rubrivivax sp.]|nr:hypothetical protein [Rubrivivax sp.]MBK7263010.1 hypothetical protein [Rubrivivax sp.]MBK8529185.1 hypothetical protein [Rubrivivax sp.]